MAGRLPLLEDKALAIATPGFDHVGITVSNLDRTLTFYRDMFGLEPLFKVSAEGRDLSAAVGVPDAHLRFAFIRIGSTEVELLEYDSDRDTAFTRRNCDVGAPHLCLHVADIADSFEELKAKGVSFYAPPLLIEAGPLAGCQFAYLRDPDGITLELFETPGTPASANG